MSDSNTTVATIPPPPKIGLQLDTIFKSHGYQKEVMAEELYKVRKRTADEYTKEQAENDVFNFFELDPSKHEAAKRLATERASPYVSRETQLATLKGMVRDYELGKRRPGLSAISVLKAIELINKMTGYEEPIKIEHKHEHKVDVFPVIGEPFKGELPPLEIIDIGDVTVANTTATPPTDQRLNPVHAKLAEANIPKQNPVYTPEPESEPDSEELFP